MRRHPLAIFFVTAFLFPWAIWGTTLAEQEGWIDWHIPASLAFWIGLPLATFGTAACTGGWPTVREILSRMIRVRVRPSSWVVAVIATPVTAGIAMLLCAGADPAQLGAERAPAIATTLLLDTWMFLLSEEPAWRGFALPRLEQRMTPLFAALTLGIVWAVWHAPLFLIDGSFQARVPPLGFLLSTIATSVTISWVFHRARSSLVVAALFHATTDVTIAWTGVMTSGTILFWTFVGAQAALAGLCGIDLVRVDRRALLAPRSA